MSHKIQYRRVNWKYVLEVAVHLALPGNISTKTHSYIGPHLSIVGTILSIKAGYAWDGASGPTVDTEATMYPALVHDALYQLIRLGIIPTGSREEADKLFLQLLKEDGMPFFRRWYFYRAVRWFGASYARR